MSLNRSASTTQSHQQKSALIVWGGWEGHFPKECTNIFGPWLEKQGYKVEVSDTLESYLDTEKLKSLNLIVPIWTQGEISKNQESNLLNAVANGVGIAGWHGSMGDSFRMSTKTHPSHDINAKSQLDRSDARSESK